MSFSFETGEKKINYSLFYSNLEWTEYQIRLPYIPWPNIFSSYITRDFVSLYSDSSRYPLVILIMQPSNQLRNLSTIDKMFNWNLLNHTHTQYRTYNLYNELNMSSRKGQYIKELESPALYITCRINVFYELNLACCYRWWVTNTTGILCSIIIHIFDEINPNILIDLMKLGFSTLKLFFWATIQTYLIAWIY